MPAERISTVGGTFPPCGLGASLRRAQILCCSMYRPTPTKLVIDNPGSASGQRGWGDLDENPPTSYMKLVARVEEGRSLTDAIGFLAIMIAKIRECCASHPTLKQDRRSCDEYDKRSGPAEFEKRGQGIDYHLGKAILGPRWPSWFYADSTGRQAFVERRIRQETGSPVKSLDGLADPGIPSPTRCPGPGHRRDVTCGRACVEYRFKNRQTQETGPSSRASLCSQPKQQGASLRESSAGGHRPGS